MPQTNPKQEAVLYGELETRLSWYVRYAEREQYDLMEHTIDSLIQFINAYTTKLLNEQLDRLAAQRGILSDPVHGEKSIPLSAIKNERNKLKERDDE